MRSLILAALAAAPVAAAECLPTQDYVALAEADGFSLWSFAATEAGSMLFVLIQDETGDFQIAEMNGPQVCVVRRGSGWSEVEVYSFGAEQ